MLLIIKSGLKKKKISLLKIVRKLQKAIAESLISEVLKINFSLQQS